MHSPKRIEPSQEDANSARLFAMGVERVHREKDKSFNQNRELKRHESNEVKRAAKRDDNLTASRNRRHMEQDVEEDFSDNQENIAKPAANTSAKKNTNGWQTV